MTPRTAFVLTALVGSVASHAQGCRVFASLEDCTADSDCSEDQRCNTEGRFCEMDKSPIEIGVILALSGTYGTLTHGILNGIEVAVKQVNDAGGVRGRPVALVVRDDEDSDELAEKMARELVARRVAGIIGATRSATTLRVSNLAKEAKVIVVSPLAGASALALSQPPRERYLFQTVTSIQRGSGLTMSVFARTWPNAASGCRKMTIVRSADAASPGYVEALREYVPQLGGCILGMVELEAAPKEELVYSAAAQALLNAKPDCAALVTTAVVGARFVRAVAKLNASQKALRPAFFFLGQSTVHTAEFMKEARLDPERAAPNFASGMVGADVDTNPNTQESKEFRVLYNKQYGAAELTQPPLWSANGYDALALFALAVEKSGFHDRARLRDAVFDVANDGADKSAHGPFHLVEALRALRRGDGVNYVGASGRVEMDDYGVVANHTLIWHINDAGADEVLKRYNEDEPALSLGTFGTPMKCE